MTWEPKNSIYVVGFSRLGQRIASCLERAHDWTYMEYEDDGVTALFERHERLDTLTEAIGKMKDRGVTAFAMCPASHTHDFFDRLFAALAENTTEH